MTEWEAWTEWHQRCALDLCSEPARRNLTGFAFARFQTYARRYAARTNADAAAIGNLDEREAWHRFETHLLVKNTRSGKAYKEWLFARKEGAGSSRCQLIESGATLIMRDVVREYIRREFPPSSAVSLDAPFPGYSAGGVPFGDLIPGGIDPSDTAALKEMEGLSRRHAREIIARIDRRERAALQARASNTSFANPAVLKAAGCGRTRLTEIHNALVRGIVKQLHSEYSNEDRDALLQLTLMTFQSLSSMILSQKSVADSCSCSFTNSSEDCER